MISSRRAFLQMSVAGAALSSATVRAQGVVDRQVHAQPRGPKSNLPFHSRFTDIAHEAGLRLPTIYGPVDHKDYIMEAVGCGCAFIDYDNDGWIDIFLLCGTRRGTVPAAATNRLYHNNRDGTFTDITHASGLTCTGWASAVCVGDYNNDGFEDLFCIAIMATAHLRTSPKKQA
jgi:anaerobic selenocysteine-containing dehydrogenase